MNEAGYKVVNYTYDAWGNPYTPTYIYHSGVSAADRANVELNPFRYRGYYYDSETGYYYLQTRYYNPEWGRFLNADGYINANGDILGYNMFAYCGNNPVMYVDPFGEYANFWQDVYGLLYAGYMHRAVQMDILKNYPGYRMELIMEYGRIDIYNDKGDIYEVKPQSTGAEIARIQLQRYLQNKKFHAGKKRISGSFILNDYTVTYYTAEYGVILYHAERTYNGKKQHVFYGVPVPKESKSKERNFARASAGSEALAYGCILAGAAAGMLAFGGGGGASKFVKKNLDLCW